MSSTLIPEPLPPDMNRGPELLLVSWLTVSVALLLVSLRVYIRAVSGKKVGWDDYTILLASAFAIAQNVFSTLQVQDGFGRNIYYLTPVQIRHYGLYTQIYILLQTIGTGLVRISVCLFILRAVPDITAYYRRWILGLLAFNTTVSVAQFFTLCFQCVPLAGVWDKSIKARCLVGAVLEIIFRVHASSAAFTDVLCVLLPMFVFRGLQVSLRDKLAIFVVFGLGFFTAATAIARAVAIDLATENPTWDFIPLAIWACLEQNIGIIVASLPALRQLFTMRKKSYRSNTSSTLTNYYDQNNRPPFNHFAKHSDSDRIRLADNESSFETSSREELPAPTPMMSEMQSGHKTRPSLIRKTMPPPPIWTDHKVSLAESVEMSPVSSPNTTTVRARKPSSAESMRLSLQTESWTESPADKVHARNLKRLSIVSPLFVYRPHSPFSVGKAAQQQQKQQQQRGTKFEETGLRHSKVATVDQMMSLSNPAAISYTCKIEGGTAQGTPKTSPEPSPLFAPKSPVFPPKRTLW